MAENPYKKREGRAGRRKVPQEIMEILPPNYNIENIPADDRGIFILFAEYMSIPKDARKPKTYKEFARKYGITENCLLYWRYKEEFWNLSKQFRIMAGRERAPEILKAFTEKLEKNPEPQGIKLWLQYFDGFQEKTEQNINANIELKQLTLQLQKILQPTPNPESP